MAEDAVRLFISYSHKDEPLRDSLATHLSNLQWQGIISSWYDRQLTAGTEWDDKIKAELESAHIILLLISPDFIASKYCRDIEIPMALRRHESKQAYVVPVILRPFDWFDAPFAKLQAFPKDAKPITTWANQDEAFVSVTQGIRTAAKLIQDYRKEQAEQKRVVHAQYLQKVEEVLSDGAISIVERDTLDELREKLGLTKLEAQEIETRAYEPYSRYKENLDRYGQTVKKLVDGNYYPFSNEIKKDLENRQRDLGIKSEDAARISKSILDQVELNEQAKTGQLAKAEKLQELEQQHVAARKTEQTTQYSQSFPSSNLTQTFEFTTAALTLVSKQEWLASRNTVEISNSKRSALFFVEELGSGVLLEMVKVPKGKFLMGTADSERDILIQEATRHGVDQKNAERWTGREMPQHCVEVPEFWMGKFTVTQTQWEQVAGLPRVKLALNSNPSNFKGENHPVEQVSWDEVVEFCERLSNKLGKLYRLPSEAEWEYACRAGATTPFCFGETITSELVNCNGEYSYSSAPQSEYRQQTTDVGIFPANAFGLYDMHGNVWEWCADQWYGGYTNKPDLLKQNGAIAWTEDTTGMASEPNEANNRLLRGGSWYNNPRTCRSANRNRHECSSRDNSIGFRVVCSVPN